MHYSQVFIGLLACLSATGAFAQEQPNPFKRDARPAAPVSAPPPIAQIPPPVIPSTGVSGVNSNAFQQYNPVIQRIPPSAVPLLPPVVPVPEMPAPVAPSKDEPPPKDKKKESTGGFMNREEIKSARANCTYEIKPSDRSHSVPHYGGVVTITLGGRHAPGCARAVSAFDEWAIVEERGALSFSVVVDPNEYQSPRRTSVFVASPGQSLEIGIRQAGNPRGEPD